MVFFSKLDRSAELVKGMADRLGHDLEDPAHIVGFKQMVLAWAGCTNPGACAQLQAENETLSQAPDYCRNAAAFKD